jgi:hypothetical protein
MQNYTISFNYGTDNRKSVNIEAVDQLTAFAIATNDHDVKDWCQKGVGFWISIALTQ